tara:strand:+ start:1857 stop:2786 length:930 start_codon:yes stop_codon:yes gene_type:complete
MDKIDDFIKNKILAKNHKKKIGILNKKNIFVFPNFRGFQVGVLVFFCFATSIFYQINFALLLSIIIFIIFFLSIIISFQNLNQLKINSYDQFFPTDQSSKIKIEIFNHSNNQKININLKNKLFTTTNIERINKSIKTNYYYNFKKRGTFTLPVINIFSKFPFGIIKSSSYWKFNNKAHVYPKPMVPNKNVLKQYSPHLLNKGNYEFDSIGDYKIGENQSRIAWKQSISKDKILTKKFTNEEKLTSVLIDLDEMKENFFEKKLSFATYLIFKFYKKNIIFSLKHKNFVLPYSSSLNNRNKALIYLSNVKN